MGAVENRLDRLEDDLRVIKTSVEKIETEVLADFGRRLQKPKLKPVSKQPFPLVLLRTLQEENRAEEQLHTDVTSAWEKSKYDPLYGPFDSVEEMEEYLEAQELKNIRER